MVNTKNGKIYNLSIEIAILSISIYKNIEKNKNEYTWSKLLLQNGINIQLYINETFQASIREEYLSLMNTVNSRIKKNITLIKTLNELMIIEDNQFDSITSKLIKLSDLISIEINNDGTFMEHY